MKRRNEKGRERSGKLLDAAKTAQIREAIDVVKVRFPGAMVPILNLASARLDLTRPQFIRAAIREKLDRNGIYVPAPSKGGSAALLREEGTACEVDPIIPSARHLTVQDMGADRNLARRPSYIRMRGHWLRAAGFEPGQRVRVHITAPGRLGLSLDMP